MGFLPVDWKVSHVVLLYEEGAGKHTVHLLASQTIPSKDDRVSASPTPPLHCHLHIFFLTPTQFFTSSAEIKKRLKVSQRPQKLWGHELSLMIWCGNAWSPLLVELWKRVCRWVCWHSNQFGRMLFTIMEVMNFLGASHSSRHHLWPNTWARG